MIGPDLDDVVASRRPAPDDLPDALDDVRVVDAPPRWLTRNMAALPAQ
jgi:hypothetical protein